MAKIETANFLQDLDRVATFRAEIANGLDSIVGTLTLAESQAKTNSGQLGLNREIEDLAKASNNLRKGVFRLLVLGDMKRGKSTFLNALIGEKLLPSDVNPCTALLTVLRYGSEKKVTIYFNDGTEPETVDFKQFKRNYTIDPAEAKILEREKKQAFPTVDYAVVEYPLPLLEKGIEIVDSPGLNDTEARNELSLGYVNNCHAILFVLRASQPCTLGERRYLENYIKGRGLTVFFLINAWDQVRESLIDPEDEEELEEAEYKLRRVFQANLAEYCQIEGEDIYDERVFEISSLNALRRRIKEPSGSLEGTGFPEFMAALNTYLTKERGVSELRQSKTLARQAEHHVREAIARRIPLLGEDADRLKQRIASVEPEFQKLTEIRDKFQGEILSLRDQKATAIADSFRQYLLNLDKTFESDFLHYQPNLNFLDFINAGKRQEFEDALMQAFEQYINDKLAEWSRQTEPEMNTAFLQLSRSAAQYGADYNQVTNKITEKLTGQKVQPLSTSAGEDSSPAWAKWAMGLFSLARGNLAGVAMAGAGFDWKSILLNYFTVIGISGIIVSVFPAAALMGPVGLALLGLGVGLVQADGARKEVVKAAKKELVKHLPHVAQEQWQTVYNAVKECFDVYEREVSDRMNDDIQSRQAELDNLIEQKETHEINRSAELERLQTLEEEVVAESRHIETLYEGFIKAVS
ncbi:dynamin family protein [Phormidium sp. CCY1219]|uniref:dynamin family protein n=1 Tax=Phormidium sp. CCY1219 TaxID=2886104 RepID=UPI002D791816|nr:dynamin family protein [Phormidium sp. CCY1219]